MFTSLLDFNLSYFKTPAVVSPTDNDPLMWPGLPLETDTPHTHITSEAAHYAAAGFHITTKTSETNTVQAGAVWLGNPLSYNRKSIQ